jgi:hypothetical protein
MTYLAYIGPQHQYYKMQDLCFVPGMSTILKLETFKK